MAGLLKRPTPAFRTGEDGVSLLTAMMIALTVFAIGGIWTSLATHQYSQSGRERQRDQARNAAEAGINEAMSRLSADGGYSTSALAALPGGTGEYEVNVATLTSDPNDGRRYIVSTGYAPTKATGGRVARRIAQQVDLISTNEFRYALFTAPGGVAGANNMAVNGDVYSAENLILGNRGTVSGSVTSLGTVTTVNNSTIGGDIRAAGDVIINNASTTVLGNVYSGGNVTITGRVRGNVQAAGSITGGTVDGSRAQYSPPPPVPAQTVPTFTWNPTNPVYLATPNLPGHPPAVDLSSTEFQQLWAANKNAFHGHYRIVCPPSPCGITLDDKWTMSGDVTVASDAPITMSREVLNGTAGALTLTVASLAVASPAILMSNNISPPDSIRIALFAPNGSVEFQNRKTFSGAVYAKAMTLEQQFTLTFVPVAVTGFTWDLASSTHFVIQSRVFREVPAP
jgi:hypothetical protein